MGQERNSAASSSGYVSGGGRRVGERPRYVTLPIMMVLAVIGFVYYVTVFGVIKDWLVLTTAAGLWNAVLFSSLALMSLVTYVIAITRDPGRVPFSFTPDVEDSQITVYEIKRKGGDLRYCQKCALYKPPRAHHCRVCKTCVLRMDHHCVWINNCVGHANYKVFFLFTLYTVTGCFHSLALLLGFAYDVHRGQIHNGGSMKISHIICGLLVFPLCLALGVLLVWHIYLILQNKTTIEHYEGVRATWIAKKAGNNYQHPYDLGIYDNLVSVLGPNIACWVCPTTSHIGSGTRFLASHESKHPFVQGHTSGDRSLTSY